MSIQFILLPLFVQVALTFVLLFRGSWGGLTADRSDAYREQFELPVLFYVLTILAITSRQADLLFLVLAWVFVVLQVLRAAGDVTGRKVGSRGSLFVSAAIVLAAMWIIYVLRILLVL
jgi:hypothetical protein